MRRAPPTIGAALLNWQPFAPWTVIRPKPAVLSAAATSSGRIDAPMGPTQAASSALPARTPRRMVGIDQGKGVSRDRASGAGKPDCPPVNVRGRTKPILMSMMASAAGLGDTGAAPPSSAPRSRPKLHHRVWGRPRPSAAHSRASGRPLGERPHSAVHFGRPQGTHQDQTARAPRKQEAFRLLQTSAPKSPGFAA